MSAVLDTDPARARMKKPLGFPFDELCLAVLCKPQVRTRAYVTFSASQTSSSSLILNAY